MNIDEGTNGQINVTRHNENPPFSNVPIPVEGHDAESAYLPGVQLPALTRTDAVRNSRVSATEVRVMAHPPPTTTPRPDVRYLAGSDAHPVRTAHLFLKNGENRSRRYSESDGAIFGVTRVSGDGPA